MAPRRTTGSRRQVEALADRQVPTVSYFGGNGLPHVEAQAPGDYTFSAVYSGSTQFVGNTSNSVTVTVT